MKIDWLGQAEAAALQLAHCCRAALVAPEPGGACDPPNPPHPGTYTSTTSEKEQAWHGDVQLQQAVARLQQLLDSYRALNPDRPGRPGCRPPGDTLSSLLNLPDDLLTHIACLSGKAARAVCRRLRTAYDAPPSGTLREPLHGCNIATIEAATSGPDYTEGDNCHDALHCYVVDACYTPPPTCWSAIPHCLARWPSQFTSLQLAATATLSTATMKQLHQALPGLRSLQCSWLQPHPGEDAAEVPQFTALTSLTVACAVEDVLKAYGLTDAAATARIAVLRMAPQLLSLQADMRFLPHDETLPEAFQGLAQLTHLDITFDIVLQASDGWDSVDWAWGGIKAVGETLRSLTVRTPVEWLPLLQYDFNEMPQLTRLCTAYAESPGDNVHQLEVSEMPSLQEFVLGRGRPVNSWGTVEAMTGTLQPIFGPAGEEATCNLTTLALPAATEHTYRYDLPEGPRQLLVRVQEACPHLTSLQTGSWPVYKLAKSVPSNGSVPLEPHWLAPVGRMGRLQRLALLMEEGDVGYLECLTGLRALTNLWLQFGRERMDRNPRIGDEGDCAGALGRLVTLRELTVSLMPGRKAADGAVRMLLEAVGGLPELRVLETYGMVQGLASEQASWGVLTRRPPPALRRLVLRANCGSEEERVAAGERLGRLKDMLWRQLPGRVAVVTRVGAAFRDTWGPVPWGEG